MSGGKVGPVRHYFLVSYALFMYKNEDARGKPWIDLAEDVPASLVSTISEFV